MLNFKVNGKEYTIKRDMKFGEYRKINAVNAELSELAQKFDKENVSELSEKELQEVTQELTKTNDEQLTLMADFIQDILGLTQDEIDEMSLDEAVKVFQETFKNSSNIKKN